MTEYLVKRFVKNYEDTQSADVRTAYGVLAGRVGVCCNLVLFLAKLAAGFFTGSISILADAFNNLSDAASSIIGYIGMKMAGKPADADHPFGHGRIEYIAAFVVSFFVMQVGFSLFTASLGKIRRPEELAFHWGAVAVLLLTVLVKLWMGLFNRRLGRRIDSKVMLATAADSLGDAGATSATILSILVFGISGVNIDGFVGLIVSLLVMWAGIGIAKDTLEPLIGQPIDPQVYHRITEFVESYEGIIGTHDLIVHNYGPSRSMATIHAEVDSDWKMEEGHEVIDTIERDCMRKLGILLVVHMDPVETHNRQQAQYRDLLGQILEGLDSRLSFHDFRMVPGSERINLIFDLVVPVEYNEAMRDTIKTKISDRLKESDPRLFCVVTVENSFCGTASESD